MEGGSGFPMCEKETFGKLMWTLQLFSATNRSSHYGSACAFLSSPDCSYEAICRKVKEVRKRSLLHEIWGISAVWKCCSFWSDDHRTWGDRLRVEIAKSLSCVQVSLMCDLFHSSKPQSSTQFVTSGRCLTGQSPSNPFFGLSAETQIAPGQYLCLWPIKSWWVRKF